MHENLARRQDVKGSSERSFGIVFAIVFILIALAPVLSAEPVRLWALAAAGVFLVLALAWTAPLRPLNRVWFRLGLVLHAVVNPLVMAFLFYGVVTPVGVLMRLTGKDPLSLKRDPTAATYWIERRPPGPAPDTMKNQF